MTIAIAPDSRTSRGNTCSTRTAALFALFTALAAAASTSLWTLINHVDPTLRNATPIARFDMASPHFNATHVRTNFVERQIPVILSHVPFALASWSKHDILNACGDLDNLIWHASKRILTGADGLVREFFVKVGKTSGCETAAGVHRGRIKPRYACLPRSYPDSS